jgi:hypothetical protein
MALKNPLGENIEISLLKRGINRIKGQPPNKKRHIMPKLVRDIYTLLDLRKTWNMLLSGKLF